MARLGFVIVCAERQRRNKSAYYKLDQSVDQASLLVLEVVARDLRARVFLHRRPEVDGYLPSAAIENGRRNFLRAGREPAQTLAVVNRIRQTKPRFDAVKIRIGRLGPGRDRVPGNGAGMVQLE